jgi:hypothetical protein
MVMVDPVIERDYRVLDDSLYPALFRGDASGVRRLMNEPRLAAHNTRDASDSYRLVGYMVNQEEKADSWKLFARSTHGSHRSAADFYGEPANKDMAGMKIALSETGVSSPPLRDVYNIPDQVNIRHPMFSQGSMYSVVTLPPPSLGSGYF